MKVRIRDLNQSDLNQLHDRNILKLRAMKAQGKTKEQAYLKFPKHFVDAHF